MRKLLLALAGATLSFYSFADLGEIKVNSYLSQPLNATIPITGVSETSLSELSIGLASNTKFKNNGISFNPELGSLQFKIMKLKSSPYLQITSTRAISSPVLNILLHYQQNTDDFYRQYTLLLDPIELNDAVVTKVSNNSSRSSIKREIVLNKIAGEKPIAISNNNVKVSQVSSGKDLLVMNLSNPEVAKQLSSFNAASMIFTTRKDDSLYTIARFEQLIYPNAQFSLNQIIVALGLENYYKLKPLLQVYESGVAIALPLPQDVNLIQAKLADQYLLDSTLSLPERLQLLTRIATSYDASLKIESSDLFIANPAKSIQVRSNIKKPFITTQALVVADESFLDVLFEYKYYLILSLLIILGIVLFRKKLKQLLIRKRILNDESSANLYSAAAMASKNAQKNSINTANNKLNPEPYDFLGRNESVEMESIEALDDLPDMSTPSGEAPGNYKYVDEELINTLENILAFDESRDDIRYKLFELYLNAGRFEAASSAYFKLDKSLDSDSQVRENLLAICSQYEFIPGVTVGSYNSNSDDKLAPENNSQLNEQSETEALIPRVADLSEQEKAQLLSQLSTQSVNLVEPEIIVNTVVTIDLGTSSLDFPSIESPHSIQNDAVLDPVVNDFSDDRILDFLAPTVKNDPVETAQTVGVAEEFLTYSVKSKLNDLSFVDENDDNSMQYDERLNLAQMYYQIEEFMKAKEILIELITAAEVSTEIKISAQQLLDELKLNG